MNQQGIILLHLTQKHNKDAYNYDQDLNSFHFLYLNCYRYVDQCYNKKTTYKITFGSNDLTQMNLFILIYSKKEHDIHC